MVIPGTDLLLPSDAVADLQELLERAKVPLGEELRAKIQEALDLDAKQDVDQLKKYLSKLSGKDLEKLQDWFKTLYEAGWYMRRWKGKNAPLPYFAEETLCQDLHYLVDLTDSLTKLNEIPDKLKKIVEDLQS